MKSSAPSPFAPKAESKSVRESSTDPCAAVLAGGPVTKGLFVAALAMVGGCSSGASVVELDVIVGQETSAMTEDAPVTKVVVQGVSPEGTTMSATAAPGGTLDFGEINGDLAYTFDVTGFDAQGNTVLRGRSIGGIVPSSLAGESFPVFAERLGGWSRPTGALARAHSHAPAVTIGERYLFMTGGDAAQNAAETEEYDLFWWEGAKGPTFPFAARTLVSNVDSVLALGSDVIWLDSSGFASPTLPTGLDSFEPLAGGSAVTSDDGRLFLVGATRLDKASDVVLEVAADQSVTVRKLVFPRAGAAATWVADVGLVVVGGSATDPAVEVLPVNGTAFAVPGFPPDATTGAGAAASTLGTVLLAGGTSNGVGAKTRIFDPRCISDCTMDVLDDATPDAALAKTAAFGLPGGRAVVVGDELDPMGQTRTYVIHYLKPSVKEMPLREPRRGATAVPAPNGTLAVMGGLHLDGTPALSVEMYFPE